MFSRPSSQEHKHAETDASQGTHLRQVKDDNLGIRVRSHDLPQLMCGFALYKPALAFNDSHFAYVLNGYI
ncbi:MAG: hypothetical protein ABSD53_23120 [Terriglobales bacterium]